MTTIGVTTRKRSGLKQLPTPPHSTPISNANSTHVKSFSHRQEDPISSDPSESSPLKPTSAYPLPVTTTTALSITAAVALSQKLLLFKNQNATRLDLDRPSYSGRTPRYVKSSSKRDDDLWKGRASLVSFSPNLLASLDASPRHRHHPYSRPTPTTTPCSIYSDNLHQRQSINSSSPLPATTAGGIDHLMLIPDDRTAAQVLDLTDEEEEDDIMLTDDEADSSTVSTLLLSGSQTLTSSPLKSSSTYVLSAPPLPPSSTPRSSSSSSATASGSGGGKPKSILKCFERGQISIASDAMEGLKRNGGRRKHLLSFVEVDAIGGGSGSGNAKGKGKSVVFGGTSNGIGAMGRGSGNRRGNDVNKGGEDDEDNGGDRKRDQDPFSNEEILDDDPLHFLSPLLILTASLRTMSESYIRRKVADGDSDEDVSEFTPRGINETSPARKRFISFQAPSSRTAPTLPFTDSVTTPTSASTTSRINPMELDHEVEDETMFIPILLPEVENAYIALTRALIRLPHSVPSLSTTLQPLQMYRHQLLKSLERDIANLYTSPPSTVNHHSRHFTDPQGSGSSSTRASGNSSSPIAPEGNGKTTKGLSGPEMRRHRDEIGAGSTAIKCAAALMSFPRYSTIFTGESSFLNCLRSSSMKLN